MSCSERESNQGGINNVIQDFLFAEGYRPNSYVDGGITMRRFVPGRMYNVIFVVFKDVIDIYVEHDCGGKINEDKNEFETGDFDSFMEAYEESVQWAAEYLE